MTVCIAAICDDGLSAVGVSDRMYTTVGPDGETQYEPPQTKAIPMHETILMMFAGDPAVSDEIWWSVQAEITLSSTIKDIAELFAKHYQLLRTRYAERDFLAPVGLSLETLLTQERDSSVVEMLVRQMQTAPYPDADALVFGIDESRGGPTGLIYTIIDGAVHSQNTAGFAVIGSGAGQADSEFLLAKYTRNASLAKAILLTYSAKKRAELVPSVGKATDLYIIGPGLTTGRIHHDEVSSMNSFLDEVFHKTNSKRERTLSEAETEVSDYIKANLC